MFKLDAKLPTNDPLALTLILIPKHPIYAVAMPRASTSGNNPAAVHQTKFRVLPRKSYSERMSETRAEIRRIVKEALREITQDPNASMRWPSYWKDIVVKYHVVIEGWPHTEVPFRNLSDVSNLQKLELLLRGWQAGEIYFRHLTDEEFEILSAARAAHLEANEHMQLAVQMTAVFEESL